MKRLYINQWLENGRDYHTEGQSCTSYEQAVADYKEHVGTFTYYRTIIIDFEGGLSSNDNIAWTRAISIDEILEQESQGESMDYERLTGHEMGVCAGRA
jgi:hypothetical protein